jgi:phosphotransferase system IIB component
MLQEYAGVNNKSKSKNDLIQIIIGNFNQIKNKMEDRKLKILNKQLSY